LRRLYRYREEISRYIVCHCEERRSRDVAISVPGNRTTRR
jgi:hypothetical protein